MLKVILIDAFPRVLSLLLAPLSLYLLLSSLRPSKSGQNVIVPYSLSASIISLGLVLSCGSVGALIALISEPHFANQLLLVDSIILSLVSQILTLGVAFLLSPVIVNKLMEASPTNLYHATYTNSVISLTAAALATELSSLIVNIAELSALVSPILCIVSSFGPIPLLVLIFVSPRTAHSTLGPKRTRALLIQLGLSQLLGCTSSALKVAKPTTWVLFSIRMVVLLRTALSMLIFHALTKLRVGRPSSDTSFKLRPPSRPIHPTDYENHDLSHGALPLRRPRTHLSSGSQTSFPKSGVEVGWKWPGSPQRLLVLEPVRTSSISTVGEGASFNVITKRPEMDPFSSTRPTSFDDEIVLHVDPQSSSQQYIDPDHGQGIQPESQEATPRPSGANDMAF